MRKNDSPETLKDLGRADAFLYTLYGKETGSFADYIRLVSHVTKRQYMQVNYLFNELLERVLKPGSHFLFSLEKSESKLNHKF